MKIQNRIEVGPADEKKEEEEEEERRKRRWAKNPFSSLYFHAISTLVLIFYIHRF